MYHSVSRLMLLLSVSDNHGFKKDIAAETFKQWVREKLHKVFRSGQLITLGNLISSLPAPNMSITKIHARQVSIHLPYCPIANRFSDFRLSW